MFIFTILGCLDQDSNSKQDTAETLVENNDSNRTPLEDIERLGEPEDSMCRGNSLPEDFDLQGCTVEGPYQGEMFGTNLGEEMEFEMALETCLQDSECSGISSVWYIGTPWTHVSATEEFVIDSASYGCTFLFSCP